jgi:hypothetical protein
VSGASQVDPALLSPELFSSQSGENQSSSFQSEAEHALKNSIKPRQDGAQFDFSAAKDQLTILKEAAPTSEIQDKLSHLMQLIQQDSAQQLTQLGHIQHLVEMAFNASPLSQHHPDDIQVSLHQNVANPFKPHNPFAAKIPTSTKTKSNDNHANTKKEDATSELSENSTFWGKIKGLFL